MLCTIIFGNMGRPSNKTGRGRGRGRGQRVETPEEKAARENKERIEANKYKLIEFVRQYPVLYDLANPEHLISAVTRVLWEEIAEKLGETGKDNMQNSQIYLSFRNNIAIITIIICGKTTI